MEKNARQLEKFGNTKKSGEAIKLDKKILKISIYKIKKKQNKNILSVVMLTLQRCSI